MAFVLSNVDLSVRLSFPRQAPQTKIAVRSGCLLADVVRSSVPNVTTPGKTR
jgi:hypothetical protein